MISNKKDLTTKIIPLSGLPRPCPKLTEREESGKERKKKKYFDNQAEFVFKKFTWKSKHENGIKWFHHIYSFDCLMGN
jgi:hypothetical protein